jgi:hypothetical protein
MRTIQRGTSAPVSDPTVPIADCDGVYAVLGPVKRRLPKGDSETREVGARRRLTGPALRAGSAVTSAMGTSAPSRLSKKKATLSSPVFTGDTPTRSKTQLDGDQKERVAMRSVGLDLGKKELSYCEMREGQVVSVVRYGV